MRLNVQTDYALRILIALGQKPEVLQSVDEIAKRHGISRNHLAKVAQDLVSHGFVTAVRGRNGGLKLALAPEHINVAEVVRRIENDLGVVECLQHDAHSICALLPGCRLKTALAGATGAFLDHLSSITIASLLPNHSREP